MAEDLERELTRLESSGCQWVVVEAALLLQASWDKKVSLCLPRLLSVDYCVCACSSLPCVYLHVYRQFQMDEVWCFTVSPEIALNRVVSRNQISGE